MRYVSVSTHLAEALLHVGIDLGDILHADLGGVQRGWGGEGWGGEGWGGEGWGGEGWGGEGGPGW
jgi:hypothetical protein